MNTKIVVTRPDKDVLKRAFWIGETRTVPGVNILPGGETVIHMASHDFDRSGHYEWNTVVQRCLIVANQVWDLLVTRLPWRTGKFIVTVGRWDLHYDELLQNKLPHLISPNIHGVGDFWVLSRCETDITSGMLFLGRVIIAQEKEIPDNTPNPLSPPPQLSWESPESLYRWNDLNKLQQSILAWMGRTFRPRK